jgi:hypothetical protein
MLFSLSVESAGTPFHSNLLLEASRRMLTLYHSMVDLQHPIQGRPDPLEMSRGSDRVLGRATVSRSASRSWRLSGMRVNHPSPIHAVRARCPVRYAAGRCNPRRTT